MYCKNQKDELSFWCFDTWLCCVANSRIFKKKKIKLHNFKFVFFSLFQPALVILHKVSVRLMCYMLILSSSKLMIKEGCLCLGALLFRDDIDIVTCTVTVHNCAVNKWIDSAQEMIKTVNYDKYSSFFIIFQNSNMLFIITISCT